MEVYCGEVAILQALQVPPTLCAHAHPLSFVCVTSYAPTHAFALAHPRALPAPRVQSYCGRDILAPNSDFGEDKVDDRGYVPVEWWVMSKTQYVPRLAALMGWCGTHFAGRGQL